MRLGKQSSAQRVRYAPNLKIPLRLTRDEEGFKNLEGKPEKQKIEVFDLPAMGSQAARKAASFCRSRKIPGAINLLMNSPDILEDCSSNAIVAWYEIEESCRPSGILDARHLHAGPGSPRRQGRGERRAARSG
jgi:hypothetical protein